MPGARYGVEYVSEKWYYYFSLLSPSPLIQITGCPSKRPKKLATGDRFLGVESYPVAQLILERKCRSTDWDLFSPAIDPTRHLQCVVSSTGVDKKGLLESCPVAINTYQHYWYKGWCSLVKPPQILPGVTAAFRNHPPRRAKASNPLVQ